MIWLRFAWVFWRRLWYMRLMIAEDCYTADDAVDFAWWKATGRWPVTK